MFNSIIRAYDFQRKFFSPLQQAEHFCNSIGILQQFASPGKFQSERGGSQTPSQPPAGQEDYAMLFANLISKCARDIDVLIESLPSEESSTELQVQSLKRLETENKESAEKLEEVITICNTMPCMASFISNVFCVFQIVRHGEVLLEKIQGALSDIAQAQLDMQNPNLTLPDSKPQI